MTERVQWEYLQVLVEVPDVQAGEGADFVEKTTGALNTLGQERWELVTILPITSQQHLLSPEGGGFVQRPRVWHYVFKRQHVDD